MMNRMQERYQKEIAPALFKAFSFKNVMQVPHVEKVVVNIGLGEAMDNPKALEAAVNLSVRFDPDHQLPDKAIDLVDKAGARTRVPVLSMMPGRKNGRRETEDGRGIAAGAEGTSGEVTELTVAQVLSDKIGVPLEVVTGHLEGMAQSRLLELNSFPEEAAHRPG